MDECMEVQQTDPLQTRLEQVYWQENEDAYHQLLAEYYANGGMRAEDVPMLEATHGWQRKPLLACQPQARVPAWSHSTLQKRGSEALNDPEASARRKIVIRGPGPVQIQ
ncbi:hypothetical protein ACKKBF_B38315 [Auxenochlorella protothecoides x Auxenochlorella symbiontica]